MPQLARQWPFSALQTIGDCFYPEAMTRRRPQRRPPRVDVSLEHIPALDAEARLRRAFDLILKVAGRAGEQVEEGSAAVCPNAATKADSSEDGGHS